MRLSLEKIESAFEEEELLVGESLLDNSKHIDFKNIETDLWLTEIVQNEVELQIKGNTVHSYSCDCADFQKTKSCAHVVAALLAFRKRQKPKKKKRASPSKAKRPKRLTVRAILDHAKQEELTSFVAEYARKDQQFSTALKARFASSIDHLDLSEKYGGLLQTLIKSNQSATLKISRSGAKKINDTLNMLLQQSERDMIEQNYAEVFECSKAIIEKITPILSRLSAHRNDVQSKMEMAYKFLIELSQANIPPPTRQSMGQFAVAIIARRHFNQKKTDRLFFHLIQKLAQDEWAAPPLEEKLNEELKRDFHNKDMAIKLQLFKAGMLEKGADEMEQTKHLEQLTEKPWMLAHVMELAHSWHRDSIANRLARQLFTKLPEHPMTDRAMDILIENKASLNDENLINQVAIQKLLKTRDIQYYRLLKKTKAGEKNGVEALIEKIKLQPDDQKKWNLLAAIYAEENMWEGLLQLIQLTHSQEIITKHSHFLFSRDKKNTKTVVWQTIEQFLDSHLGRPPSVKMRNFLRQLILNDTRDLAKFLLEKIRKKYGARNSLSEELDIFRL